MWPETMPGQVNTHAAERKVFYYPQTAGDAQVLIQVHKDSLSDGNADPRITTPLRSFIGGL